MMRLRIVVYICALMTCDVQTHPVIEKDSGEQSALQEALLLVELLKSEYARVLRENSPIKESEVNEKDLETCAPTTVPTDAVTHTHTDKLMQHNEHRARNRLQHHRRSPEASTSYYHGDYLLRVIFETDFSRRRFNKYQDYYGSYGPRKSWRRMDYDNIFGPQPEQTTANSKINESTTASITNSTTNITLTSVLTTASTTASEIPTSSVLSNTSSSSTIHLLTTVSATSSKPVKLSLTTLKPTEHSITTMLSFIDKKPPTLASKRTSSVPRTSSTIKITKIQTKHRAVSKKVKVTHKKLSLVVEETKNPSTNDPEQAQVAAELKNELKVGIGSSTSLLSSRRWAVTWRPSTRVHLARSTPFHLPLPENHAFCYTNPESSLCRTFIK